MRRVSCYRMRTFSSRAVRSVRGFCRWKHTSRRLRGCGSRVRENGGDGILDTLLVFRPRTLWKQRELLTVGSMAVLTLHSHPNLFQHDQVSSRRAARSLVTTSVLKRGALALGRRWLQLPLSIPFSSSRPNSEVAGPPRLFTIPFGFW